MSVLSPIVENFNTIVRTREISRAQAVIIGSVILVVIIGVWLLAGRGRRQPTPADVAAEAKARGDALVDYYKRVHSHDPAPVARPITGRSRSG